ncbi:hypothetical protein [Paractinoplanes atraurantiacus]|uniref:hypothetical protein n=1 Tax=Paractinoplanes atraurantiacus TaxID=1036182 RepID=UPI0011781DD3|nr:hypothetical protein [Actinoplanes atraurantiacus]
MRDDVTTGEAAVGDGIRVESDGMTAFSGKVHDDTSRTIEPGYSDARVYLDSGVRFGATNAGGGVHAAKQRYADSLRASSENIVEYMYAARVLADAATSVAAMFDRTDLTAQERVDYVNGALHAAAVSVTSRPAL